MSNSTRTVPQTAVLAVAKDCKYTGTATSVQNNAASWQAIAAFLKGHPKATRAELTKHLQENLNHGNFVRYALGRGWLVETK